MDFRQLLYFTAVVNEGTISAAAKKLHMTQPPLSTQIRMLEDEMGCLLFERGSRSIRLTDAGRIMYERASVLLRMSSQLKDELDACSRGSHGTLRLGVISSVSSTLCCQWFRGFHEACPDVRFEVSEANTYQLLETLQNGLLELAIVRTPFPTGDFLSIPLKSEQVFAVGHRKFFEELSAPSGPLPSDVPVPPDAPDTASMPISLDALSRLPIVLYRRWETVLADAFRSAGHELTPLCKNDDARTTAFWADNGLGVGILPESVLPLLHGPETIRRPIGDSRFTSDIFIIRNKNSYLSAVGKSFIEYVRAACCQK